VYKRQVVDYPVFCTSSMNRPSGFMLGITTA